MQRPWGSSSLVLGSEWKLAGLEQREEGRRKERNKRTLGVWGLITGSLQTARTLGFVLSHSMSFSRGVSWSSLCFRKKDHF